jgi:hypothetical protein
VPLEIADPKDEVCDDGGAWIYFEAEQLMGIDGEPGVLKRLLCVAERVKRIKHFAFKPLHVLQRDIEKVSASACGVEDADGA